MDGFTEAHHLEEVREHIENETLALVYVYGETCSVCHAVMPQIKPVIEQFQSIATMQIDSERFPEVSGEWTIFTVPVILLFLNGKEILRKARFIEKRELENQLTKIVNALKADEEEL